MKILGRDVILDRVVIVLDVKTLPRDRTLRIFVVDPAGEVHQFYRPLERTGEHAYDFRSEPGWRGKALYVGTPLLEARGSVREPVAEDEFDAFLDPEPLLPATANLHRGHHLFGAQWEWTLLLVFLTIACAIYAWLGSTGRRIPARGTVALLIGFGVAWVAMDLRLAIDRWTVVYGREAHGEDLMGLQEAIEFGAAAGPLIGSGTWTADQSLDRDGLSRNYLIGYAFADRRFLTDVPGGAKADFVVTRDRVPGEVIYTQGGLYLIQRTSR
jgi:hypothetical protein